MYVVNTDGDHERGQEGDRLGSWDPYPLVSLAHDLWTGDERTSLYEIIGLCDRDQQALVVWALICRRWAGCSGPSRTRGLRG